MSAPRLGDGPQGVNPRAHGANTFNLMISFPFMTTPIYQTVDKRYRITPGQYLSYATRQFEADPDVAHLIPAGKRLEYVEEVTDLVKDPRKSMDENALVPGGPAGGGSKLLIAKLVAITGGSTSAQ
ncbi:uncharacterized protein DFL_000118 [Arthrobotrys flagrans]|uniref:Uncharacterized protein n=1 Tax=Arthrobotrys flagrans TaxID=97331 RepID=A0A437AE52_ARTFL|nr:hypothetical protein DFL_000118 [Arthrobotrys flagrans]